MQARRFTLVCALVGALFACASCARPAWTIEIRDRYGLTNEEIQHVQFFTSAKISLRREEPYQERKIVQNALQIEDRVRVDDVVISRGTPGVALRVEGDHLLISFSREHPERALWFSRKATNNGRYYLSHVAVAPDEQPFTLKYSPGFAVRYAGRDYRVVDPSSWAVFLTYEDPQSFDEGVSVEKPKGWRLR